MVKFLVIAIISWLIGLFGWAQIIGSIQNLNCKKNFKVILFLWSIIVIAAAIIICILLKGKVPLLVGYFISFIQVVRAGKIE